MKYLYIDVSSEQISKKQNQPCGDLISYSRDEIATTVILSDGIGSGIKANLAATLCNSRFMELLKCGFSFKDAFTSISKTMNEAREKDLPFAAFIAARVLNDGISTIYSYEMPAPIFISSKNASILSNRTLTIEKCIINEAMIQLDSQDSIILISDGVTQAGMGELFTFGWSIEGVSRYINGILNEQTSVYSLPNLIIEKTNQLCKGKNGDDSSVVLINCLLGKEVTVLTGPPSDQRFDSKVIKQFLSTNGKKIVCGGTTAGIAAKYLGKEVKVESEYSGVIAPPKYVIDGIDLVTEGAVTLNQLYNILDEDPDEFEKFSGVTSLYEVLLDANRITFMIGNAKNPASEDLSFRQKGILTRKKIIPLLAEKLRNIGKIVIIEEF